MSKTQNLFSFVSTLGGVRRFSLLKQVSPENVLEHTGMVAIFTLTLVAQMNEAIGPNGPKINNYLALSKAIVHDFDEVVTGDVVRPTKYHSPTLREAFKAVEAEGVQKIASTLDLPGLPYMHSSAKDGLEGYVVAFADQMAAAHHVWSEVMVCGNMHMAQPARAMRDIFRKLTREIPDIMPLAASNVLDGYTVEILAMLDEVILLPNPFVSMS
jgi:5'-deoxynucleotidase YfbR-like HD superfamily hydrolase